MTSFFSAASALLTGKSGPFPAYAIGERESWFDGRTIWQLHTAVKRDDSTPCSVLVFDALQPSHNPRRSLLPLAKNALRRLRTTRHPDVIKLLDSAETPTAVYIAVERIRPLGKVLSEMHKATQHQREEWIGWGLARIVNALKFLNTDMGVSHGNVRCDSIFLAASGEWRLGGCELMSKPTDDGQDAVLYTLGGMVPDAARYAPPEVKQQGWGVLRDLAVHVCDSYALALVILEAYNGTLPPRGASDVAVPPRGRVPEVLYGHVKRMMLPNAKSRLTMSAFAEAGFREPGGFFSENRLCKVSAGLDGFVLASEEQRSDVLRTIKTSSTSFPPDFLQFKVLPVLVNAMTLSNTTVQNTATREVQANNGVPPPQAVSSYASPTLHASRLLPLILQLGQPLSDEDWSRSVAQTIIKAYTSPDRGVRMALLDSLTSYIDRLETKQVSEKIWPNLIGGFADASAALREATVRAIVPIAPKLTERILNNDLLRQLARTQVDVEPRIRTNTTVLLGNLAPKLNLATRKNVLVPAFVRSLKDTFAHARMAGLMAFMATADSFEGQECARQIVPAMCPCLLDDDKGVRNQAKEVVTMYFKKIYDAAKDMPTSETDTTMETRNGSNFMPSSTDEDLVKSSDSHTGGYRKNGTSSANGKNASHGDLDYLRTSSTITTSSGAMSTLAQLGPPSSARSLQDDNVSDFMTSASMTSAVPSPPAWASMGDLMDVMDDEDDWTSFSEAAPQTRAKAVSPSSNPSAARLSANRPTAGASVAATASRPTSSMSPSPLSASVNLRSASPASSNASVPKESSVPPAIPTSNSASATTAVPSAPSTPVSPTRRATASPLSSSASNRPSIAANSKPPTTNVRPSAGSMQRASQRRALSVKATTKEEEEEEEAWDW